VGRYFLDTYALMEYLAGSKIYAKYFSSDHLLKTSILNLMELYFHVLQDAGEYAAENSYIQFRQFIAPINDEDVKNAIKFRLRSRSKKLDISYTDAVGYVLSNRLNLKFLTGDAAFKSLESVEFVK
jgi:predicted nucleic acid-binding protein